MSEEAPKFILPAEPVDGYVLEYWDADIETYRLATADPRGFRATYHVNTAWRDLPWSKDSPIGGAPLINQWAIETVHGSPQGRSVGWEECAAQLNADVDMFPSREAAMEYLRERIASRIILLGQERDALRARLRGIQAEALREAQAKRQPAEVKP